MLTHLSNFIKEKKNINPIHRKKKKKKPNKMG